MGKINVLSFEVANLIAAGEVVERPSSVLKELIENSIDAKATEIVAEIKKGGVSLIRVTDNGTGIEKDDLPVALKRHATSKICAREDLESIMTLGFRGEALAAISSVSQVTIITKTDASDTGYMLTADGGEVLDISEVGSSRGTTVVVENLFYNVPARRKFLKKDSTEAMNVAALVEKVALSRPDISFQLLIDGEEKFKTSGDGDLLHTIRAIFGKEFSSKLIFAEGISDGIKVSGYIGRSDNVRKNRNLENFFINGRYVKSLTAQAAIERAYTSYIAPECFPACVLFIEMNPAIVDVNVHPAKLEVKFSDERRVFEAIYYTVKSAIEKEEYRPEMQLGAKKSDYNPLGAFVPIGADTKGEQIKLQNTFTEHTVRRDSPIKDANSYKKEASYISDEPIHFKSGAGDRFNSDIKSIASQLTPKESVEVLKKFSDSKENISYSNNSVATPTAEYKFIGEAFDCYVIIEYQGDLLIIDKHAAHERIIFEDLNKNRKEDGRVASQTLLLPLSVILTPDELSCVKENKAELEAIGFEFFVNEKSADIYAIPDAIRVSDAEGLFIKMAGELATGVGNPSVTEEVRRERALYQVACKAAIKGGRIYDRAILEWLIGRVLALPDITVCPHGRPIAYKLTKNELDRQFNRIK